MHFLSIFYSIILRLAKKCPRGGREMGLINNSLLILLVIQKSIPDFYNNKKWDFSCGPAAFISHKTVPDFLPPLNRRVFNQNYQSYCVRKNYDKRERLFVSGDCKRFYRTIVWEFFQIKFATGKSDKIIIKSMIIFKSTPFVFDNQEGFWENCANFRPKIQQNWL